MTDTKKRKFHSDGDLKKRKLDDSSDSSDSPDSSDWSGSSGSSDSEGKISVYTYRCDMCQYLYRAGEIKKNERHQAIPELSCKKCRINMCFECCKDTPLDMNESLMIKCGVCDDKFCRYGIGDHDDWYYYYDGPVGPTPLAYSCFMEQFDEGEFSGTLDPCKVDGTIYCDDECWSKHSKKCEHCAKHRSDENWNWDRDDEYTDEYTDVVSFILSYVSGIKK